MAKIYLGNSEQKIAAGTVILMVGLCVFDYRNEFDAPHLHSETPTVPVASSATWSPATNVATQMLLSTYVVMPERSK